MKKFLTIGLMIITLIISQQVFSQVGNVKSLTRSEQQIELSEGFSFVSSRIIAADPDMLVVLATILNQNLDFVRNSQGQTLRKIGPNWVNGIGDWIIDEGYLIKVFSDDSFTMNGDVVDPFTPIPLVSGFQFISYFPDTPMNALIAFENILAENLVFIRNSQGQILRKIGPNWVNGIGDCNPGEGYLVKMLDDDILIYPPATKLVTFQFHDAAQDTLFSNGLSTLFYRHSTWTQDSTKTSTNGTISLNMLIGETYNINGSNSHDMETLYSLPPIYTALKRPGDLEAFEQTALDDESSPVTISAIETTIKVSKLHKEFPIIAMQDYASSLNGWNQGIRKFSTEDANAPVWVDISNGGLSLTAEQMEWYQDIVIELTSIPHVYVTLPFEQSATTPAVPHNRISINESNPGTPSNGTTINDDHEILIAYSLFRPNHAVEYYIKMEFYQAFGDINDVGGTPNIMNGPDQNYTLNHTGRDIFAVQYLFQPKTKF